MCKKIDKNYSVEMIADILEEDIALIESIYEVAIKQRPNYDMEAIYRTIKKC